MGTRNLTCVVKDGKYKVAQYGQWDGYPEGNGLGILNFIRENLDALEKGLRNVKWITKKEIKDRWVLCGASPISEFVTFEMSEKHAKLFPESDRDTGDGILKLVADFIPTSERKKLLLTNSIDFAGDSLFCEWAYVVDLDKRTFEIYKGFVKSPTVGQRFSEFRHPEADYFPVEFVKSFELSALPTDEEFISELCPPEEDDE